MESDMPIELVAARLWNGTRWHYPNAEQMVEENKRLRAELAALRRAQADPLAEMWSALEEYQPQANADGHGESWRVMCSERTEEAARAAVAAAWAASRAALRAALASASLSLSWASAAWASAAAAAKAAEAAELAAASVAAQSIAAIRRAKEVKP